MKILVTGGTGLLGSQLTLALLRKGHELTLLSRDPEAAAAKLGHLPLSVMRWNAETDPVPKAALRGVDAIFNLAGEGIAEKRWSAKQKEKILQTRVVGTTALRKAIIENGGPKIFINASAIGFYGDRGDQALDESSPAGTGFLSEVCQAWEKAATENTPADIRVCLVRIGVVLSSQGGALKKMLPILRTGGAGPLGNGRQWMSWIHIDDVVGLLIHCLENAAVSGPINATAPEPATNKAFTKSLAQLLSRPAFLPAPGVALRVALGEMADLLLGSTRVYPKKGEASGYSFLFRDLNAALADLVTHSGKKNISELQAVQWFKQPPDEVFSFFADAKNLEKITPPTLKFNIFAMSTPEVGSGTEIDYRLKVHGVPVKWRSIIQDWQPGVKFVDTQAKGPYQYWHHTHLFEPLMGGTLMTDRVRYKIPAGPLGDTLLGRLINRDLGGIFAFRKKVVGEHFGDLVKRS